MKESPIIFSGPMVRAILAGLKIQTRRIIKNPERLQGLMLAGEEPAWCPYGGPGDLLYVRETWRVGAWSLDDNLIAVDYLADNHARREWLRCDDKIADRLIDQSIQDAEKALGKRPRHYNEYDWEPGQSPCRWRRSFHMPKEFSRIWLKNEGVIADKLQEITEADAEKEGMCISMTSGWSYSCRAAFQELWDKINKDRGSWKSNPPVWVVDFSIVSTTGRPDKVQP